jgi:hypothetical protein
MTEASTILGFLMLIALLVLRIIRERRNPTSSAAKGLLAKQAPDENFAPRAPEFRLRTR